MPILSPAESQSELALVTAVDDLEAGAATYPYTRLSADDFERLAYALFTVSAPPGHARFWDQASIMVRGADAGRDVILTADDAQKGVVQCKRLESAIALPVVFRELVKLILFPLADDSLPQIEAGLTYYLALAHECAGTVIDFFDRPTEILASREADVEAAVGEVMESYVTLAGLDRSDALARVKSALPRFQYCLLRPVLLDAWVSRETGVATQFFRHRVVVDHARVDAQYVSIMDLLGQVAQQTQGVPVLTDVDLKLIKERIDSVPETHRVAVGFASLFGFPREMFVGDDNLRRRLAPLTSLLNQLGADFIDWMFQQSNMEAEAICSLGEVIFTVHPFARQVPAAFLAEVTRDVTSNAISGKTISDIVSNLEKRPVFATDDERLAYVRATLLAAGGRYLQGDFSAVEGDQELKALKLNIIQQLLLGLPDEAEMVMRLDHGIRVMRPHLLAAASRIRQLGAYQPCVFLSGTTAIDDPNTLERMAATIRSLEESKRRGGTLDDEA